MYTIYGIPNCDTVKKSISYLKDKNVAFEFHDYKKKGISEEKIRQWLQERPWEELVNRKGLTWKQIPETERPKSESEAISLMMAKPSVIKRPIVEQGHIKALGFNLEEFDKL